MERLIKIGNVEPKKSGEIQFSKIGIGFEKLDRDVFDPEKAYDKIAEIGVKKREFSQVGQDAKRKKEFMILNGLIPLLITCLKEVLNHGFVFVTEIPSIPKLQSRCSVLLDVLLFSRKKKRQHG